MKRDFFLGKAEKKIKGTKGSALWIPSWNFRNGIQRAKPFDKKNVFLAKPKKHTNAGGYILLEMVIGLILLGVLLPFMGQFQMVAQNFLQKTATKNSAQQVRHYIQFVLREDIKNATSLSQIGADVVIHTVLGDITYSLDEGVLKRRFSGRTIRLNPDLDLRSLAMEMTRSPMFIRLETNIGVVEVQHVP